MPVDLAFELSYLLSDKLGEDVEVKEWSFEPSDATLCVRVATGTGEKQACIQVKPCKGIADEAKAARCIAKNLVNNEKLVEQLAEQLRGAS